MNQQLVVPYWQDRSQEDGMLFVRTKSILTSMARAYLLAVGLIVMAISMPIQSTFGTVKILDLVVYPDGTTHITTEISTDPLKPEFFVDLFGSTIDNFVAEDENGFLLSSDIEENNAVVTTLGALLSLMSLWTVDEVESLSLQYPERLIFHTMQYLTNVRS